MADAVVSESDKGVIGLYRGWTRISESLVRPVVLPAVRARAPFPLFLPQFTLFNPFALLRNRLPPVQPVVVRVTLISIDNGAASPRSARVHCLCGTLSDKSGRERAG